MKKSKIIIILIIGMIIGLSISGLGIYAATTYAINSNKVEYKDNSNLGVTNVQAAIDGTYNVASGLTTKYNNLNSRVGTLESNMNGKLNTSAIWIKSVSKANISLVANMDSFVESSSLTLEPGTYILVANGLFSSKSTQGAKRVQIFNKTTNASMKTIHISGNYFLSIENVLPIQLNSTTQIVARISSQVALSGCSLNFYAVRLK